MIPETAGLPAGSETNGSKACVGFAEFLNGSWRSIHPPNSNATLDPGLLKIKNKITRLNNLSFYLTIPSRN
jgi:hypothetical protein